MVMHVPAYGNKIIRFCRTYRINGGKASSDKIVPVGPVGIRAFKLSFHTFSAPIAKRIRAGYSFSIVPRKSCSRPVLRPYAKDRCMLTLALAVGIAVLTSFTCSLTEAALYAVPWSAIERARKSGRRAGEVLYALRSSIDKPIAAILTMNTVANTAGSAVAGAAFMAVFGGEHMGVFAAAFTCIILMLGEIVPKTLGVAYCTPIMMAFAIPLQWFVRLLSPIIWLLSLLTRAVTPQTKGPQISEDDICAMTSLSREAGSIQAYEERFVRNVLALDQKRVYDIMTPRTVVFSLPGSLTVDEAYADPQIWHFSRIPVFGDDNEDLLGLVERRTLARCSREGDSGKTRLIDIMRPLHFVQETQTLDRLLREFLQSRVHLFAVLDEYGGLAGVVTLEDVMEEILGREIVDESDSVADLQTLARQRRKGAGQEQR